MHLYVVAQEYVNLLLVYTIVIVLLHNSCSSVKMVSGLTRPTGPHAPSGAVMTTLHLLGIQSQMNAPAAPRMITALQSAAHILVLLQVTLAAYHLENGQNLLDAWNPNPIAASLTVLFVALQQPARSVIKAGPGANALRHAQLQTVRNVPATGHVLNAHMEHFQIRNPRSVLPPVILLITASYAMTALVLSARMGIHRQIAQCHLAQLWDVNGAARVGCVCCVRTHPIIHLMGAQCAPQPVVRHLEVGAPVMLRH